MRYEIVHNTEDYDSPEQYLVRDTKTGVIMLRVQVSDYREIAKETDYIKQRRKLIEAELLALDTASLLIEKLEAAAENGEVL